MDPTRPTEVESAAALAAQPRIEQVGDQTYALLPPNWRKEQIRHEHLHATPTRARGIVHVHDATGFVHMVARRRLPDVVPIIYGDETTRALVAILNDDDAAESGWRDYRVELVLRETPEWSYWKRLDGQLVEQEKFADHVEGGLKELREPEPALMLEIAQTMHAQVDAAVKGGTRLASGAVQFRYEETIDAAAGGDGTITIPSRLEIAVAPFVGSPTYAVGALFRYRLSKTGFRLGYALDRPRDVERAAFIEVREKVAAGLEGVPVVAGPAPGAVTPL